LLAWLWIEPSTLDLTVVMGPEQNFLTWDGSIFLWLGLGPGQPSLVWVWKISLKMSSFSIFLFEWKKSPWFGTKSTQVKGGSASYLLWDKSMVGSGQGRSLDLSSQSGALNGDHIHCQKAKRKSSTFQYSKQSNSRQNKCLIRFPCSITSYSWKFPLSKNKKTVWQPRKYWYMNFYLSEYLWKCYFLKIRKF